jgi:hypothetical protein
LVELAPPHRPPDTRLSLSALDRSTPNDRQTGIGAMSNGWYTNGWNSPPWRSHDPFGRNLEVIMHRRRVTCSQKGASPWLRAPSPPATRSAITARECGQGYEARSIWLPDTNSAEFKAEANSQSRLIARTPHDSEDQAFVDSLSEF